MSNTGLKQVVDAISALDLSRCVGRVSGVENGLVDVK